MTVDVQRARAGAATIAFLSAACSFTAGVPDGAAIRCSVDAECPAPQRCVEGPNRCGDPNAACTSVDGDTVRAAPDGSACGDDNAHLCIGGACTKSSCGDGVLDERREDCDDGANNDDVVPNACRLDCRAAFCGDGVVDDFESCDTSTEHADSCQLCVDTCDYGRADCDADSPSICDCEPELLSANEPIALISLLTMAVDASGIYWVGGNGELRVTPVTGGLSTAIGPAHGSGVLTLQIVKDSLAVWRIDASVTTTTPHLYRLDLASGVEVEVGIISHMALDQDALWVIAGDLARVDLASSVAAVWFDSPGAVLKLAIGDNFVAIADDVGDVRVSSKDSANFFVVAERQLALGEFVASGDVLRWTDGEDVHEWRADLPVAIDLPRLSDAQVGTVFDGIAVQDSRTWLSVEERSARRPGGIMQLDQADNAWRMKAHVFAFALQPYAGRLYFMAIDGIHRMDAR